MSEEPAENIGRGAGDRFAPGEAGTRAEAVVDALGERYWQKTYGGRPAFECLVRTILSQNTSDKASQPAHDALMERYGPGGPAATGGDLAASLAAARQDDLAETISSAGLYNQKSETIIRLAGEVREEFGGAEGFDAFVRGEDAGTVRERLLAMKGVGPKTADCVLLFAGGRAGVFPVDTHVHRIARRMGLAPPDADHEGVRAALEADVPAQKCGFSSESNRHPIDSEENEFSNGGTYLVDGCPLYDRCDRVGVDEVGERVVDPAEAE